MKIIDNSTAIIGDELRLNIGRVSKLRMAASCFLIYAYEALKAELNKVDSVQFIFTISTFVPSEVTDKIRKERREFFIPKAAQESSVYGTEFEIQLRNNNKDPSADAFATCASKLGYYVRHLSTSDQLEHQDWAKRFVRLQRLCHQAMDQQARKRWMTPQRMGA